MREAVLRKYDELREAPLRKMPGLFRHCPNGICSSRSGNKVPQSARLSEGGGGAIAIWAMPK